MVDYEKLADQAKAKQETAYLASQNQRNLELDPRVFFQRVTAHIGEEMNKANVELRKKGIGTIARNYLPNFEGRVFLAVGTAALCRVELEAQMPVPRIRAIISGPPHGKEISRKEFFFSPAPADYAVPHSDTALLQAVVANPHEIAQDIIAGIVVGRFD